MSAVLAPDLYQQFFNPTGTAPANGYLLFTYQAGTAIKQPTYLSTVINVGNQNQNPIFLDAAGTANVYLDPALVYKFVLAPPNDTDPPSSALRTIDNIYPDVNASNIIQVLTQVGFVLNYPQTQAEALTGVVIVNGTYPPGNMLRYGFTPNAPASASANTAIAKTLFNPSASAGPTGLFSFINTTGSDIYYFNGVIPMRDGIHIDGQGCGIAFSGPASVNDANSGLFFVLRDFICENVNFSCTVDTTLAVNSGMAIQIGARGNGFYFTVFDSTQPAPLGNIIIRNCRFAMSNTGPNQQAAIQILGGVTNLKTENLVISGNATLFWGIYSEFGWATAPGNTAGSQSSHPHNMTFTNTVVNNLLATGGVGAGIGMGGAYNCTVDGLYVNGANSGFYYSPAEALFFNVWSVDVVGAKRSITLRNICGANLAVTGAILGGASAATGYLSGAGLTPIQKCDLMTFSMDGFALSAAGFGIQVSGQCVIKNGTLNGAAASGQLMITDDCMEGTFENINIRNGTANGVRGGFATVAGWATPRLKSLIFNNCRVAGNATQGYTFANTRQVRIIGGRIGYNILNDGVNEATQNPGILAASANSVIADSVFITVAGDDGGSGTYTTNYAYQTSGTSSGCGMINPLGNVTSLGRWDVDGTSSDNSSNLGTAAATINITNKYLGARCINTSTNKLFIAQGSTAASPWISVDGATTITPV